MVSSYILILGIMHGHRIEPISESWIIGLDSVFDKRDYGFVLFAIIVDISEVGEREPQQHQVVPQNNAGANDRARIQYKENVQYLKILG